MRKKLYGWTSFKLWINNMKARIRRLLADITGGGLVNARTSLEVVHIRNGEPIGRRQIVLDKMVTTAFVTDIVTNLKNLGSNFPNYKYHGTGTGTTAEAIGNTALVTEVGTRVTGTQETGATANQYKSIGTVTYASSYAITEHGLFNASTVGTLMDRTLFAAVNVVNGDSIQFTFTIDFNAGG